MRKIRIVIFSVIAAVAIGAAFASTMATSANKNNQKATLNQVNKSDQVWLYDQPENGKVIKKLAPNNRLVPIFKKGNWVKVGDPQNGMVGWINLVQYQKARYRYYRPNIQTLFVQVNNKNKKGKPTLNIVAYKNGEQVTPAEAKKLYQQLRKQQQQQYNQIHRMTLKMQQMMNQDFLSAEQFFNASGFNPPWIGPVILIQRSQNSKNSADASNPKNKAIKKTGKNT